MERLLRFVEEDLRGMSGYSGKKPTIALLRKIQNIENIDSMYRAIKAFDSNVNKDEMALEDLVETAYNNLRKEDLGSAKSKPKPPPKLKAPSKPKVKKIPIEERDITVAGYPKPKMVKKPTLVKPKTTPKTPKAPRPKAKATSYKVVKPAKYTVKKVAVKPTPKVVRAPAKAPAKAPVSKPKKTMTAEHRAKIAKGVKKHHADCKKAMAMMKSKK